jgi:hypothetical protein
MEVTLFVVSHIVIYIHTDGHDDSSGNTRVN